MGFKDAFNDKKKFSMKETFNLSMKITVKVLSEVRRIVGWDEKEIEFEGSFGDLLKSLKTIEGKSLYQVLVEDKKIKDGFVLGVNGRCISSIDMPLQPGDRVLIMDIVRLFHGG
jgi:molybdopterin converting factor small subunit